MKTFLAAAAVFLLMIAITCNAQPKSDYEVFSSGVTGAVKYHFFLEKTSPQNSQLQQGMDYLDPDVTTLKIGESATPVFVTNLLNDGAEYTVGVVAENVDGFYSGMGVGSGVVGEVPQVPAGVGFRRK